MVRYIVDASIYSVAQVVSREAGIRKCDNFVILYSWFVFKCNQVSKSGMFYNVYQNKYISFQENLIFNKEVSLRAEESEINIFRWYRMSRIF